ncbi:DUF2513 domain-containing protein [Companilactobacillus nodensis]|uniref:DUF2513 domain-containing protein n=1 Tax=Companilactobacillus nodensis DSM 19682 = JCM 14932 = NBRC 107160 TaxID=1423775 RepID=A0A0R1K7N1_9LACO|nr:DUF2513 domain-containing protein [Companilactobacillus nodensis]KRK79488.1 hypothetical protein FD03_GL000620 [Companilactobacillus nodensis DSM 19682 = JCM 14932 = NBRC 107160]
MELDYDFVRKTLIECAESEHLQGPTNKEIRNFADENHVSLNELAFTIDKMEEAGFITGKVTYSGEGPYVILIGNLTWDGNQYLNSIRNPFIWKETKQKLIDKGVTASFSVITALATAIAKQKLGL